LPTPPFRLRIATRWWPPATGVRTRLIMSRRRNSAADDGTRMSPPVAW